MLSPKIFLLAFTLVICSQEAEADQKCWDNFGFCQHINNSCSGNYVSSLCSGPNSRRCCIPAYNDDKCHSRGGKCQSTSIDCVGGQYFTGLCGGPFNRRCCISNATDSAYNDEKCEQRGGKCYYTVITCVDGSYVSGLCGGPANRRCCVPSDAAPKCDSKLKHLACEIFQSVNVLLTDSRTPSATDMPYSNLRDMCHGRPALRSSDQCNSTCQGSGRFVCLHKKVLRYLAKLKNTGRIVVEELAGACHKGPLACSNYEGRAVGLLRDGKTGEYIKKCRQMKGQQKLRKGIVHCRF